jgi:hypothetical protein
LTGWQKRARQLLLNPAGRAALKEFGIDVEIAKNEKELQEKPIVVTLCPTYSNPEAQMQDALGEMVRYTREKDFATIYSGPPLGSSVVHWSRNAMIQSHLNSGKPWTHVLFIDDDIVVEPDALERLLSHKKDIVAGLCTRRQDPPMPNIRLYDEETGKHEQIYEWPEGQLIGDHKRLGVGTGLMLISKHALEQVAQAYFDCLWEQEFYGLAGERLEELKAARVDAFDKDKTCYWFRFLYPIPKLAVEMGEDMSFCFIARRYCNISVYVDTKVQPGHIGNYPFSVRDFLPHRDECVLRAKVNGHYPMEVPPMKISILCPTRGRPEQVKAMLASLEETSTVVPEVVFYVDDDDDTFPTALPYSNWNAVRGPRIVMTDMWNKCAEKATGEILMQSGDDMLFKTKGWDEMVRRAFACFPDRLVLVHGDDGAHGNRFSTHSFVHRAWIDAVGYFLPPYFSSDFGDTWLNDVFNAVNRRICLPFVTEHLHPMFGKGQWDKTHQERLERHKRDNPEELYRQLEPERIADIRKVAALLNVPWKAKEHADDLAYQSSTD